MTWYFCARWGSWMIKDWHLYHEELIHFGSNKQYRRLDWRKII